jgi:CheY-like chemotaxis protein
MHKILVIDDNVVVRNTIIQMLESEGYEVVSAEDGRRGLSVFRSEKPDLVITDIIMPEKEGIETIRDIRGEAPDTKIIAISGGGRMGNTDERRDRQAARPRSLHQRRSRPSREGVSSGFGAAHAQRATRAAGRNRRRFPSSSGTASGLKP